MKGDLHTLKKVCLYGSRVMYAGTIVLSAALAAFLMLGAVSLFSDGAASLLQDCIGFHYNGHTALQVSASFSAMAIMLLLAVATVFTIYKIMLSIREEHSPFVDSTTDRMIRLSQIYLVCAVLLALLELVGVRGWVFAAFVFFGCLLLAVVLYSLALIIRYGAVLQDESDHTL